MTTGILLLVTLFLIILLGVPVAYAFIAVGLLFILLTLDVPAFSLVTQSTTAGADSVPMTAIPLFLLAGSLMNAGGITRRLIDFAGIFFGRLPGGLGVVNVGTNVMFAGLSGSAIAGASAIGKAMIPEMEERGYPRRFGAALTSSASIVGGVIPPAIPLVVYAIAANEDIRVLLTAGLLPGLLIAALFAVTVLVLAAVQGLPRQARPSMRAALLAARDSIPALLMPVIILGGIMSGLFTATEAAAIAAIYALLVSTLYYRELNWRKIPAVISEAARSSAVILFIIAAAAVLGQIFVRTGLPAAVSENLEGLTPIVFLLLVNVILLLVGTFMEANAAIIIFTPLLLPTATALGVDPVHFGVVIVVNLMIGLITPPIGMSLFVTSDIAKVSILEVAKANLPFLGIALAALSVITFLPELSLWLVQ
ncbi:TRAP transporter large permease [Nesterenkonia cremea]|uniref:Membrane protein n=1 Tax=Nesterenkonia cremea TaxID=1882340 RepID=A0A917ES67_9MICC|nr:TRAP transporter large permease [Nesterenkonia cremea]GGE79086.1 membrane protein [Nesterenkonia cremea]